MANYLLGTWERNGYDDSDFYASYWDGEAVRSMMTGSTRFAGWSADAPIHKWRAELDPLTDGVLEKARLWLADLLFRLLRDAEIRAIELPNDVGRGDRVRLTAIHRNKERDYNDCRKCGGSGKWVNPRNADDKRDCFGCDGLGFWSRAKKGGKLLTLDPGIAGKVLSCVAHGTFYRNGYNKPSRFNRHVEFLTDDGRVIRAPLEKLRLDKEPMSDDELRERADAASYGYDFNRAMGMTAWSTTNEALNFAERKKVNVT